MRFKLGRPGQRPSKQTDDGDTLVTHTAGLEEQIKVRARHLEKTQERPLKPSGDIAARNPDQDEQEEPPARPHAPIAELTVEPLTEASAEDSELDTEAAVPDEASAPEMVNLVQVGLSSPKAGPGPLTPKKEAAREESDAINSLFADEDEEVNPLASLIASLPDVTAKELSDDLREITGIITECQRRQTGGV